jgi:hypothetical protein
MANNTETAIARVELDGKQAEYELEQIKLQASALKKELKDLAKAGKELEWKQKSKDLDELNGKMAGYRKVTTDVTAVLKNLNGSSLKDLKKAQESITAELGKMARGTDEWTAKNKQLGSVTAEISKVKASMSGVSKETSLFDKLKSGFEKIGPYAAAAWAAIEIGKSIMESTGAGADKLKAITEGLSGAFEHIKIVINQWDFSNFFKGISDAYEASKKYAEAGQEIENKKRELLLAEADASAKILAQEKIMANVNEDKAKRIEAINEIIRIEGELEQKRVDVATNGYTKEIDHLKEKTKLKEEDILLFEKEYTANKANMEAGVAYNTMLVERKANEDQLESAMKNGTPLEFLKKYEEKINSLTESIKTASPETVKWANIVKGIGISKGEELDKLVKAYQDLVNAQNSQEKNSAGIEAKKQKLLAQINKVRKAHMAEEIDDMYQFNSEAEKLRMQLLQRLKQLEEDYARGKMDADEREIQGIRDKYDKISKEVDEAWMRGAIDTQVRIEKQGDIERMLQSDIDDKKAEQHTKQQQKEYEREQEFLERRNQLRHEYELMSLEELEQEEITYVNNAFQQKLLTAEEQERAIANIHKRYADIKVQQDKEAYDKMVKKAQDHMTSIRLFTELITNLVNAAKDSELSKLESEKAQELKIHGKTAKDRERIEANYKEKELAIQKKYADKEFAAKVSQIIASGAVAVIQALAQLGPIAGAVAAGIIGVTTGFQISAAEAERNKVKNLASGQYPVTGASDGRNYNAQWGGAAQSGIYEQPTLIAEQGREMVISAPHLRHMELNYPKLVNTIMATRYPQRADGNYPGGAVKPSETEIALISVIADLKNQISNGISAHISYQHLDKETNRMAVVYGNAAR